MRSFRSHLSVRSLFLPPTAAHNLKLEEILLIGDLMSNLLVRGGNVVTPWGLIEGDVLIVEGKIRAVGKGLPAGGVKVVDATNKLVLPGAVDEHVHMREPGLLHKDDFTHGTMAAAAGGVTTVGEMPNTLPPVKNREILEEKARLLSSKAYVDFGLWGVLTRENAADVGEMIRAGAVGVKAFMGPTTGNIPPPSNQDMLAALEVSAELWFPIAIHGEDAEIVNYYMKKMKATGRDDPAVWPEARPPEAEEAAAWLAYSLAKASGGWIHIVHIGAAEVLEALAKAAAEGVNLTGETCPHYLILDIEDYSKYGNAMKVNPPVRGGHHKEELMEAVRSGLIQVVASDHAPHAPEEKNRPVWEAASGFSGTQTLYPSMIDLALKGELSIEDVVRLVAESPAKVLGLWPRKGGILPGADGDVVIVDPKGETVVTEEWFRSRSKVTPFMGWRFRGSIDYTILRGEIIYEKGEIISGPTGRWVKPLREQ